LVVEESVKIWYYINVNLRIKKVGDKMWFDAHIAGLIGGIFGGLIGVCGGIIGIIGGLFVRKGKYKKFTLTLSIALIVLGAISLIIGAIALIMRQPYHVWYPFVLVGGISTAVFFPLYFNMKKIYEQVEHHLMQESNNVS
jgi:uncharacterized membrane protein